jgi:hypothetical protein
MNWTPFEDQLLERCSFIFAITRSRNAAHHNSKTFDQLVNFRNPPEFRRNRNGLMEAETRTRHDPRHWVTVRTQRNVFPGAAHTNIYSYRRPWTRVLAWRQLMRLRCRISHGLELPFPSICRNVWTTPNNINYYFVGLTTPIFRDRGVAPFSSLSWTGHGFRCVVNKLSGRVIMSAVFFYRRGGGRGELWQDGRIRCKDEARTRANRSVYAQRRP